MRTIWQTNSIFSSGLILVTGVRAINLNKSFFLCLFIPPLPKCPHGPLTYVRWRFTSLASSLFILWYWRNTQILERFYSKNLASQLFCKTPCHTNKWSQRSPAISNQLCTGRTGQYSRATQPTQTLPKQRENAELSNKNASLKASLGVLKKGGSIKRPWKVKCFFSFSPGYLASWLSWAFLCRKWPRSELYAEQVNYRSAVGTGSL